MRCETLVPSLECAEQRNRSQDPLSPSKPPMGLWLRLRWSLRSLFPCYLLSSLPETRTPKSRTRQAREDYQSRNERLQLHSPPPSEVAQGRGRPRQTDYNG